MILAIISAVVPAGAAADERGLVLTREEIRLGDADLLYRPAFVSDPTAPMQATYQTTDNEEFDTMFKAWFDDNATWSYIDSAYPWTRLGYTYDWADNRTTYGFSEFIIFSGAALTVEYTCTADVFVAFALAQSSV